MSLEKVPNAATGLSLNDRFTAIASSSRRRSRSRSRGRLSGPPIVRTPGASMKNVRLLSRLERKHKIQAAMKLKRVCVTKSKYKT